jgi:hypothetical protein
MVVVPLKEYPVETTKPVQPGVSRADVEQPYSMLANTLKEFGDAATTTATSLAEQAGAQAVTRDANGDVVVAKAAFVGPAATAFEKTRKMAALTEYDGDAQRTDIKLRTEFRDNPEGYREAAGQFAKDMEAKATSAGGPEIGLGVRRVIERTTTQTYRGLLGEHEALELKRSDATMTAGTTSARDDLMALARGGVTSGPDWDAASDKYNTLVDQRMANPRMAYPKEQADFDREQFHGELQAQGFLHRIDETYKNAPTKAEGAATALEKAQSILSDPSIKLSPAQREAYYHKAVGEVRANEAIRKQDMGEARLASQQLIMASSMGVKIDPADVEGVAQMHIAVGDQAGAARLYATMARKPLGDDFGRQPIADMTSQLNGVRGQAAAKAAYDFFTGHGYSPAQSSGIVGNLIHESSLDPATIHDQGTGLGVAGWRLDRLNALQDFAREKGKAPTDFQTQLEFLDKEIRSSPTEATAFRALAASTTPEEAAAAFIHYERPKGYDPNNLAASSGFNSRVALSKQIFTGQGNVSINTPASALWLQANRATELDTKARATWKDLWQGYTEKGIRPSDKDVNDLVNAARATGDHDLLEKIAAAGDQIAVVQDAAQRSLPAQEAQISTLHALGAEGGLQPGQQAVLKDLERRYTAIQAGLKDNPVATTVANFPDRFKTPPPLNVQDPQQLAAGLGYRARIAQFAAQNWQTGAVPALDKADLAAVQGALATPDPAVKAGIFQAITAALPEDVRNATLKKLGEGGPEQMVSAAAGGLMGTAPDIAQSVLRGQAAIKTDKGYLPHEGSEKTTFNEDFAKALPSSTFTLAARTDPAGPMAIAKGAIEARYADLSAQANDTTGKHNPDRLKQAVADVTGGVLDHNGGKLIAPARGMTQGQFDGVLWGITDADLGNGPRVSNLGAADQEMKLSPQEKALYERHLTNLIGSGGVTNPNGSRSTLKDATFEIDGRTYVIPTVRNGELLSSDEALKQARTEGLDKFPSYGSEAEASARYDKLHSFMEKDTAAYFRGNRSAVTTLAGEPVTPQYLQTRAQLESVGDGRYFVRLGRDASRPIYAYQGANSEMPQKFILDLRGRDATPAPFVMQNLVAP